MQQTQEKKALVKIIFTWAQKHPELIILGCLIILGWFIRFILAVNTGGLVHPDEIYQSLEAAHRLKYGYGLGAWEFVVPTSPEQEGAARSYLYPLLFYVIFELCELGGIPYGIDGTLRVVRIFSATYSTLLIPIVFYLSKELFPAQNKYYPFSLFAAFLTTVCFEFLFYGIRTITNSFVTIPIFLAIYLHLVISKKMDDFSSIKVIGLEFAVGALLGFACALRMDSVIFFGPFFLLCHRNNRKTFYLYFLLFLGFCTAFFIQGLTDLYFFGIFLASPINWVKYNIIEGKSAQWGVMPIYAYALYIFIVEWQSGQLQLFYAVFLVILIIFLVSKILRYRHSREIEDPWFFATLQIFIWFLTPFVILSLVAHKEDRFTYSLYPILLILFAAAMKWCFEALGSSCQHFNSHILPRLKTKRLLKPNEILAVKTAFLLVVCACFVQTTILHSTTTIFWAHYHDVNKALEWVGRQEDSTGVIVLAHWIDLGGWTHLHKDIPWFTYEINDAEHNSMWPHLPPTFNYLVTRQTEYDTQENLRDQISGNFTLIRTTEDQVDIWRREPISKKEYVIIDLETIAANLGDYNQFPKCFTRIREKQRGINEKSWA